ncbi:helix-turn-helix domain-containing protein [Paenibacillus donghaensis]|nr:helix-turn-helix domain-containing protein [Paenibacillus donghaensis]
MSDSFTKDWLVMYTIAGQGYVNNGDESELLCTQGTITIISPGVRQDYYTVEGSVWEKFWAHFIPRITWMDWIPASNTVGPIYHHLIEDENTRQAIESAFRRVLSYKFSNTSLQDELTMNALEEIVLLVAGMHKVKKTVDPRIKEILGFLAKHYAEDHHIEDLAHKVCLSPSRLSHLFKEQVGDSIIETLTKYRLKQAENLLQYTLRSITDIALGVGFSSPDYFGRQFASFYGVTPSKFRNLHTEKRSEADQTPFSANDKKPDSRHG